MNFMCHTNIGSNHTPERGIKGERGDEEEMEEVVLSSWWWGVVCKLGLASEQCCCREIPLLVLCSCLNLILPHRSCSSGTIDDPPFFPQPPCVQGFGGAVCAELLGLSRPIVRALSLD